jgi:hypothetical protein
MNRFTKAAMMSTRQPNPATSACRAVTRRLELLMDLYLATDTLKPKLRGGLTGELAASIFLTPAVVRFGHSPIP